jgi:hypothetical protein
MMADKKFMVAFFATALLVLALIAAGNILFDAAGVFHLSSPRFQRFINSYVPRLQHAAYGLKLPPYERSIKIALAEAVDTQCYVIGSSRHMSIRNDSFPEIQNSCNATTNLAVSGGTFEDMVILSGIIVDKKRIKHLYIGVDPWTLSRQRGAGWVDFKDRYYWARQKFRLDPLSTISQNEFFFQDAINTISMDYLIKSIRSFLSNGSNPNNLRIVEYSSATDRINSGGNTLLSDGSLVYPASFLDKTPPPDHLVGDGSFNLDSTVADQEVIHEFVTIVRAIRERDIRISLVLMPYHPKVFLCRKEWVCAAIDRSEQRIRKIAREQGIETLGSYDPNKVAVTREDFLDDLHVSEGAVAKALSLRQVH